MTVTGNKVCSTSTCANVYRPLTRLQNEYLARSDHVFYMHLGVHSSSKIIQISIKSAENITTDNFLDHRVSNSSILPATCHLELAGELTKSSAPDAGSTSQLTRVCFARPMLLDKRNDITVVVDENGGLRIGKESAMHHMVWCSFASVTSIVGKCAYHRALDKRSMGLSSY
eukprot:CAMPEP_0174588772 /NCGR_PEP_ID=MMETSP0929-20130131/34745_1 /TAXON_ID=548131 ORGANISM="Ostreococcus mediterraneus, Strain clade-D-RCC2572" /NCGR_SAMPLE_ID=MMETSP0929 /ASSEMBLY_ACC=CAM_ASM_000573 /LENGTH=170 /DNA_ID=CAMNT_0015770897 /DNA_START=1106 /DNA_END=1615 /DNA_ORIENTATION=-